MRKLFALLSVATVITLASCGGESKEVTSTDSTAVVADTMVVVADTAVVADTTVAVDTTVAK